MEEENKKQYQVTLDKPLVEKAKEIQLLLARAENLSCLLNSLLIGWVMEMQEVITGQQKQVGGIG